MIKIRTITYQLQLGRNIDEIETCLSDFNSLVSEFSQMYSKPRTHRVVTDKVYDAQTFRQAREVVKIAKERGMWGACIPIDMFSEVGNVAYARDIILDDFSFVNLIISNDDLLNIEAVRQAAQFIIDSAVRDQMSNFRIGVSSVNGNKTPFFPFATAEQDNQFTIGLELIDLLTELAHKHRRRPISQLKDIMMSEVGAEVERINALCHILAAQYGMTFGGVDLSIAPYPYPLEEQSVVTLVEKIGNMGRSRGEPIFEFGSNGTYFINAMLTSVIKGVAAKNEGTGFNGVMYSLLEDTYLANRYEEGNFDIDFLKHLATSCGCGVDMVPMVCIDDTENAIAAIILDTYTASSLMKKPLGVRVLPIPGAGIGDRTNFKHLFFTNTKIREVGSGITTQNLPKQDSTYKVR